MGSRTVAALVALNVVLLAALVCQWLKPNVASAQMMRPSDYIMIPGSVQASPTQLVYLIDTQHGWLSARFFDGQQFQDMPPMNLSRYFSLPGAPGGRNGR